MGMSYLFFPAFLCLLDDFVPFVCVFLALFVLLLWVRAVSPLLRCGIPLPAEDTTDGPSHTNPNGEEE
jgi:hypothetical protein